MQVNDTVKIIDESEKLLQGDFQVYDLCQIKRQQHYHLFEKGQVCHVVDLPSDMKDHVKVFSRNTDGVKEKFKRQFILKTDLIKIPKPKKGDLVKIVSNSHPFTHHFNIGSIVTVIKLVGNCRVYATNTPYNPAHSILKVVSIYDIEPVPQSSAENAIQKPEDDWEVKPDWGDGWD